MKICPQCQTAYDDTKNFCHHDGASLTTSQLGDTSAQTESPTCSQCAKPAETGEQFCSHCGTKLEGIVPPAARKETPLSRSTHKLQSLISDYYQQLPPEKSEFHRGAALGFGAALLIMLGFIGYWKAQGSPQASAPRQEAPAVAKQDVPTAPQDQILSSSFARVVKQPDETPSSAAPTDRLPAGSPPEAQPPNGSGPLLAQEPYSPGAAPPAPPPSTIPAGTYRVTTLAPLRSEPYDDAPVVIRLKSGIKIQVVGAVGDYLEVHSKKGRAPGYVLRDHAVLVQREKAS
jgi:double zinc ribbon protein